MALMAIRKFQKDNPDGTVLIIVHSIELKNQWIKALKKASLQATIQIINTASKTIQKFDFVIIDECHRSAAPVFSRLFEVIDYTYLLCLTATIERLDGREEIILQYAPEVCRITIQECRKQAWIADYSVFLVGVFLSEEERERLKLLNNHIKTFSYSPESAQQALRSENKEKRIRARNYFYYIRQRRRLLMENPAKLEALQRLLKFFPQHKTLIFCETILFCKKITQISNSIQAYHSQLKPAVRKEILTNFANGAIHALVSARALEVGVDVPDCNLVIIIGGDSSRIRTLQRRGRGIRYMEDKKTIIIELFMTDSKEEDWVSARTEEGEWFESVDKFLQNFQEKNIELPFSNK